MTLSPRFFGSLSKLILGDDLAVRKAWADLVKPEGRVFIFLARQKASAFAANDETGFFFAAASAFRFGRSTAAEVCCP